MYAKRTFGKTIGMLLGLIISVNGIISGATVSLGFAGYFFKLFEASELLISLGIIGLIFLINVSGIRQSSVINIVFTLIEAAGLLLVIYVAFPFIGSVNYLELPEKGWNGLLTASALGFFAYIGFEEIVKLAEETKNPEKTIPRALFIANGIVAILYMLVAVCAVSAISAQQLGESQSPLADVVGSRLGKSAVTAITIIALFSTANTILSNMLGSSRVLLDMSRHIKWMKAISYVSPKRQTPFFALVLILIIMCLFALIGKIETIARIANLFIFTTFIVINLCVIVLRVKEKEMRRPYRIPLNIGNIPVLSVAAMLLTLLLLIYNVIALSNL